MDIHNTELFKGVSCEECNKMLHCFKSEFRGYSAGAHICDYSETEKYIGIITKGSVKIIRTDENGNNSILEHLGENGIFGKYIAYATGAGDGIYVECETPCEVVYIGSEHITKRCSNACECHSRVVENMFDIVTKKSVELSRHLYVLSSRTIRDKLLSYFRLMCEQNKNTVIELPFSTTALAEYLCVDRSAMTRELKRLKDQGIILMDKRKVKLLNGDIF